MSRKYCLNFHASQFLPESLISVNNNTTDWLSKMHIIDKILYTYWQQNSDKTARKKSILLNHQQSKLFTSIAQMYRNRVIIYGCDRINLQSDMSFFTAQIQFFTEST